MGKNCNTAYSAKEPGPSSGQKNCSQVGQNLLKVVKPAKLMASTRSSGPLNSAEIENIFDLLKKTSDEFSLYTQNFSACADIQKSRRLAKINQSSLSRFVLQSYCKSIASRVFVHQIEHSDLRWIDHFLDGLLIHIEQVTDPIFTENVFMRYRFLALDNGAKLEASAIFRDETLQKLVAGLFASLRCDADNYQALRTTINRHLVEAFHLSGPSPLKVINQDLADFFGLLVQDINPTGFRQSVNAQLKATA